MHFGKKRGFGLKTIDKLGAINLISHLAFASVATIWAVYLDSFFKQAYLVGLLVSLFTLVSFISHFFIIPIIEEHRKHKLYLFSLLFYFIAYFILGIVSKIYIIILMGFLLSITATLRISSFGIIVRDKSSDRSVSKNEGLVWSAFNFAWLIGPLIAGFIVIKYGFRSIFLIAAIICFLTVLLFKIFRIKDSRIEKKLDKNVIKNIKGFFKNKSRTISYIVSGGISFWWILIYIFIPIYIIESGFSEKTVGLFLFGVIIPLVISEYFFGKLAGKIGFRKIFVIGYFILFLAALICFFISNIYFILGILILASFGISMLEPTTESYFFDIIKKQERDKYYPPYNTTIDINMFLGSLLASSFLLLFPFKFLFILFSLIMLIFALISSKVRKVIEAKK